MKGGWCLLCDKAIEDTEAYFAGGKKGRRAHARCTRIAAAGRDPREEGEAA